MSGSLGFDLMVQYKEQTRQQNAEKKTWKQQLKVFLHIQ